MAIITTIMATTEIMETTITITTAIISTIMETIEIMTKWISSVSVIHLKVLAKKYLFFVSLLDIHFLLYFFSCWLSNN
jgi:hypothetical protein